jgi:hypothetical protein
VDEIVFKTAANERPLMTTVLARGPPFPAMPGWASGIGAAAAPFTSTVSDMRSGPGTTIGDAFTDTVWVALPTLRVAERTAQSRG